MGHLQTPIKCLEARVERLVQPGRESQRHLCGVIADFDVKKGQHKLQWLVRLTEINY